MPIQDSADCNPTTSNQETHVLGSCRSQRVKKRSLAQLQRNGALSAPVQHMRQGWMSVSLIGRLGQARFPSLFGTGVAHPGPASCCSLGDAAWDIAARKCRIGSGEPCFGTRLMAQQTFSALSITRQCKFISMRGHEPRPVKTTPFSLVLGV